MRSEGRGEFSRSTLKDGFNFNLYLFQPQVMQPGWGQQQMRLINVGRSAALTFWIPHSAWQDTQKRLLLRADMTARFIYSTPSHRDCVNEDKKLCMYPCYSKHIRPVSSAGCRTEPRCETPGSAVDVWREVNTVNKSLPLQSMRTSVSASEKVPVARPLESWKSWL